MTKGNNQDNPRATGMRRSHKRLVDNFTARVVRGEGAEKAWAFRNLVLVQEGFCSCDELIDMSLHGDFTLHDPFAPIRRGSVIGKGVVIRDGSAVKGKNVVISEGSVLDGAVVSGSNITVGPRNRLFGEIGISNLVTGPDNVLAGIAGDNRGEVRLGKGNHVEALRVDNSGGNRLAIGDDNRLYPGLSINLPFAGGWVWIGSHNSLGRDGGGVISSSYRFGRGWSGHTVIGSFVETTRGAEVLGYSLLGFPPTLLESSLGLVERDLVTLFVEGSLRDLRDLFDRLVSASPDSLPGHEGGRPQVSLFGSARTKRCCCSGTVKVKDDSQIRCSYLRDVLIPERCLVHGSAIVPSDEKVLSVSLQGCNIENMRITKQRDWHTLCKPIALEEYPLTDADFYQDWQWDIREGRISGTSTHDA